MRRYMHSYAHTICRLLRYGYTRVFARLWIAASAAICRVAPVPAENSKAPAQQRKEVTRARVMIRAAVRCGGARYVYSAISGDGDAFARLPCVTMQRARRCAQHPIRQRRA